MKHYVSGRSEDGTEYLAFDHGRGMTSWTGDIADAMGFANEEEATAAAARFNARQDEERTSGVYNARVVKPKQRRT